MSRPLPLLIVVGMIWATPTIATATDQTSDGPYVGGGFGVSTAPRQSASGTSGGTVQFKNGPQGSVFVGKSFSALSPLDDQPVRWRGEVEVSRRTLDLSTVSAATAQGSLSTTALMGNGVYDFQAIGPVQPYIGAGIGVAKIDMNGAGPFGGSTLNGADTVGALQLIAGASYTLTGQIDLFTDYRYLTTRNARFTTASGTDTALSIATHSVLAGLRFNFGERPVHGAARLEASSQNLNNQDLSFRKTGAAPDTTPDTTPDTAPEPVPAAAPVADAAPIASAQSIPPSDARAKPAASAPGNYTVYFALNASELTAEGLAVVEQAAASAQTLQVTRLKLIGHTDRSGEAAYNIDLSRRRALAVKTVFVGLGFNDDDISIKAKGESDPAVPTQDGQYEPKNRRVEIILP